MVFIHLRVIISKLISVLSQQAGNRLDSQIYMERKRNANFIKFPSSNRVRYEQLDNRVLLKGDAFQKGREEESLSMWSGWERNRRQTVEAGHGKDRTADKAKFRQRLSHSQKLSQPSTQQPQHGRHRMNLHWHFGLPLFSCVLGTTGG